MKIIWFLLKGIIIFIIIWILVLLTGLYFAYNGHTPCSPVMKYQQSQKDKIESKYK